MDTVRVLATEWDPAAEADDELATAAGTDRDAFALLYERHRLAVFRYLRARTHSDDEAGDLTALVFERALVNVARYRPTGAGFVAWLMTIARNAAIDRARVSRTTSLPADIVDVRRSASPEDALLDRERRVALVGAINALPEVQREAIVLRYAGGLGARDIGAVLGKSEAATQKLLNRALTKLRESHDVDR